VSDVATNLRAALDFIAWQLAIKRLREEGESREPRNTLFSICSSPKAFLHHKTKGQLADVLKDSLPLIESFQPYSGSERPENHLQAILRELSNITKHRALIRPRQSMRLTARPGGVTAITFGSVGVQVMSSNPSGSSEPPVSLLVNIEIPSLSPTEYDISVLDDIHRQVRDKILPRFSVFFD
jgi:hypothetical protein